MKSMDKSSIDDSIISKKVNGKNYLYYRVSLPISSRKTKDLSIYIGSEKLSKKKMKYHKCIARGKFLLEIIKTLYEMSKDQFKLKYITDDQLKKLEFLRFSYVVFLSKFSKSDAERYEEAIFTKYVYGTTSIEGNTYTLRETDLTLNDGITVGGKETRELHEIENYIELKKFEKKHIKNLKITPDFIKKIHSILMKNIDNHSNGNFRRVDVGIRGTDFEPVPYIFIEEEITKLCKWIEDSRETIYPIELISLFHQKFEEIHPFEDGNGRVGRELMRLLLKNEGFPTVFIDKKSREEYLKGLDEGNRKKFSPLIQFIINNLLFVHLEILNNAFNQLQDVISAKLEECKECTTKKKCEFLRKKYKEYLPSMKK